MEHRKGYEVECVDGVGRDRSAWVLPVAPGRIAVLVPPGESMTLTASQCQQLCAAARGALWESQRGAVAGGSSPVVALLPRSGRRV